MPILILYMNSSLIPRLIISCHFVGCFLPQYGQSVGTSILGNIFSLSSKILINSDPVLWSHFYISVMASIAIFMAAEKNHSPNFLYHVHQHLPKNLR